MNYFKTSRKDPGTWIDKCVDEIEEAGGKVNMFAKGFQDGRKAYCLEFTLNNEPFRAVWPVLPCNDGNETAADRQAATMMYHDIKARAMKAKIFGLQTAFFEFKLLDDGRTAAMLSNKELQDYQPKLLTD